MVVKKTNVFLEVEDRVYELVIAPHKRQKTFSKLVAALLKGYIEDDYVRAFGDDTIDDMRKASVSSLDEILDGMHESMSNLGLLTDEMEEGTQKGKKFFEEKQAHAKAQEQMQEDSSKIKQDVEDLKKDVGFIQGQNSKILELLQQVLAQGVPKDVEKLGDVGSMKPVRVVEEPRVPKEKVVQSVEEVESVVKEEPKKVTEPVKADVKKMMGLLQGNVMQF